LRAVELTTRYEPAQSPGSGADDGVRLHDRTVGQLQTCRATVLLEDARHLGAEVELDPALDAPLVHRPRQLPHAAPDIPGPEGVLHVRQDGRARRRAAGVDAVRERMAVQQGREPRVPQLPGADLVQRAGPSGAPQTFVLCRWGG